MDVHGKPVRKSIAKNAIRNRRHRIPGYIKELINKVEGDILVPMTHKQIYSRWVRILEKNNLPKMTFHDLRYMSASVMAALSIPDKYAQDRGGWSSDHVMKQVYMETFSSERVKADDTIDQYFENIISPDATRELKMPDLRGFLLPDFRINCRLFRKNSIFRIFAARN